MRRSVFLSLCFKPAHFARDLSSHGHNGRKPCSPTNKPFRTRSNRCPMRSLLLNRTASSANSRDLLTQAAQRSDQLSQVLYQHGGASYLQVLTNETNYFSAELHLVQAQLSERLALVQLYQALGGGWQQ